MIVKNEPCVYHIITRTALSGLPFKDVEKDMILKLIKRYSQLFFVEVLGFSIMSNHLHLVCRMLPGNNFSDSKIKKRLLKHYGDDLDVSGERIQYYRERLSRLANFVKEIKQSFTVFYNAF